MIRIAEQFRHWHVEERSIMITLESLQNAVARLSPAELAEFRQWFAEFDGDVWDSQIEADAAAGKLDSLAAEALAECGELIR
jgi:hypothetical protein